MMAIRFHYAHGPGGWTCFYDPRFLIIIREGAVQPCQKNHVQVGDCVITPGIPNHPRKKIQVTYVWDPNGQLMPDVPVEMVPIQRIETKELGPYLKRGS